MTDLAITPADVQAQGGAGRSQKVAAATIVAGDALVADDNALAILADDSTAALAAVMGIALHGA